MAPEKKREKEAAILTRLPTTGPKKSKDKYEIKDCSMTQAALNSIFDKLIYVLKLRGPHSALKRVRDLIGPKIVTLVGWPGVVKAG